MNPPGPLPGEHSFPFLGALPGHPSPRALAEHFVTLKIAPVVVLLVAGITLSLMLEGNAQERKSQLTVTIEGTGSGEVTSKPPGITCRERTCAAGFPNGEQVMLTATPLSISDFAGWKGAGCSGTKPTCIITLSGDQEVTAAFKLREGA